MSWIELSLDTTHEAVDWVNTLLATTEYSGSVHITNYENTRGEDNLADETPEEPDWAFTICLYLPDDTQANVKIEEIADRLSPLHRTGLTNELQTAVVEEKPAPSAASKLLAHRIGKRFVVLTPSAPYRSKVNEIPLRLKKSFTFGSGLHPATILSLHLLECHVVPNMKTLDLGSGSGILSVAMAKLGAHVLALDNDPIAVRATQDAVRRNSVEQQVIIQEGSLGGGSDLGHWMGGSTSDVVPTINPTACFDLIVANILARVHIALAHDFRRALRQQDGQAGILITAGFTMDYENEVLKALEEAGFEAIDCHRLDEWVAFAHRLTQQPKPWI